MIHSSSFQPRIYPFKGVYAGTQIDRIQEMTASVTLNRTKIEEVGRSGLVDWRKSIPALTLTIRQLEYGDLEFWRLIANTTGSDTVINWSDFSTPQVDIAAYETDDDDVFKSTVWYPRLRITGFGLNIGDPDALVERNFSFAGEDEFILQGNNKYLIVLEDTSPSGPSHTIVIGSGSWSNYPSPVLDPDVSGTDTYILKLIKVTTAGVTTELDLTTDYTYDNGSTTITIPASANGDTYKAYYSATTYITGSNPFTNNDSDSAGLLAQYCTILLRTSTTVYRLQSVGIDVTFDRFDVREIGNKDVVARGVRDVTCRITLGRILDTWAVEEAMRGVTTGANYGKIDIRKFESNFNLIVKIYSDDTKSTFRMGYKFTDLAPVGIDAGAPVNDYVNQGVTLEGEAGFVTNDVAEL